MAIIEDNYDRRRDKMYDEDPIQSMPQALRTPTPFRPPRRPFPTPKPTPTPKNIHLGELVATTSNIIIDPRKPKPEDDKKIPIYQPKGAYATIN